MTRCLLRPRGVIRGLLQSLLLISASSIQRQNVAAYMDWSQKSAWGNVRKMLLFVISRSPCERCSGVVVGNKINIFIFFIVEWSYVSYFCLGRRRVLTSLSVASASCQKSEKLRTYKGTMMTYARKQVLRRKKKPKINFFRVLSKRVGYANGTPVNTLKIATLVKNLGLRTEFIYLSVRSGVLGEPITQSSPVH